MDAGHRRILGAQHGAGKVITDVCLHVLSNLTILFYNVTQDFIFKLKDICLF